MSTATAFPAPETIAPETPPEPNPATESASCEPSEPNPASWWETVLGLLAQGASVAALAILNRKGDHWLPMSIPTPEETVDTVDSVESVDTVDNADSVYTTDTLDTANTTNTRVTVNTAGAANTVDTMDTLEDFAYRQILAEIEAMDSAFPSSLQGQHPVEPPTKASSSANTVDRLDTMDTMDTAGIPVAPSSLSITTSESGGPSRIPPIPGRTLPIAASRR